ncbi:MAG: hypothetical protein DRG27_03545 [Deltaproteobacteria bacterium]|nr:MAG: hypothetical protein DRG27_03545 [Deltaproteobacteria bacterium]
MANVDFQRVHRNNERREENTVGGEFIPADDGTLATGEGAIISSLPKNAVLVGITVVGIGLAAATIATVTIGGVGYTAAVDINDGAAELAVNDPVLLVDAEQVILTADADITTGRVIVLPRFIEFDLTTGNRVEAV